VTRIDSWYSTAGSGRKDTQSRKWLVKVDDVKRGVLLDRVERMPAIRKDGS
jgi:hypothetical protein